VTKRVYILIALLVFGGILGNILRFTTRMPDRPADFSRIPLEFNEYTGFEKKLSDMTYEVLKADVTTFRDYTDTSGNRFGLFVAYFESQKYGSQIHSPKNCLPGGGWRIESITPHRLELPDGDSRNTNLVIMSANNQHALVMYWFETRSGAIRDEYSLKVDLVKNSLLFRPTDAAIVRITINVTDADIKAALQKATEFIQDLFPSIKESLPF
jgi:EpsI family protein